MKSEKSALPMATMSSGEQVIVLTSNPSVQRAIVDLLTLKRLAALLPVANLSVIKTQLIAQISDAVNMENLVDILAENYNFHTTVNLIQEIGDTKFVERDHNESKYVH